MLAAGQSVRTRVDFGAMETADQTYRPDVVEAKWQARWAARRRFGGVSQTKEVYRQVRSFMWLEVL